MREGRFREELYVETELRGMVSFFVVDGHPDTGRFTEESLRRLKEGMHFGDCAVGNEKVRNLRRLRRLRRLLPCALQLLEAAALPPPPAALRDARITFKYARCTHHS